MKKLVISALCGLCLMGAFVASQAAADDQVGSQVAIARRASGVTA